MSQELNFYQRKRLEEVMVVKGVTQTATYLGDGLFHVEGYETEFDISMSDKDADYVLNGIHLTREGSK